MYLLISDLTVVENCSSDVALFLVYLCTCKVHARLVLVVSDDVGQIVECRVHVTLGIEELLYLHIVIIIQ